MRIPDIFKFWSKPAPVVKAESSTFKLTRLLTDDGTTVGKLTIDGVWIADTIEDQVRDGPKIPGETAIPAGRYRLAWDFSPRFQRYTIHVLNVPGFSGVRVHSGNTKDDTAGCIIVGKRLGLTVRNSREILSQVEALMLGRIRLGATWLEVE